VRSVLYRFPDLDEFEKMVHAAGVEAEFGVPPGETVEDGEWVLAIFELGAARRATSAAGWGATSPEGARLVFEPRDLKRLAEFVAREGALDGGSGPGSPENARERSPIAPSGRISRPTLTERAAPPSPRVLIVDDDPDIREVVSAMLEAVGLTVVAVESGEDALDCVVSEAFDLLVLDWNLPRMSGLELCRTLRKDPGLAALPVLFLTANASSQDMVEAFASGGDDYVVKPFRAPELGARIFSLLRRARKAAG
jgi:two-component system, OmpR family, phosphate regulon response regulator PhoB